MNQENKNASEEQIKFANVLDILSKIGFVFLITAFILYISGLLPNFVELEKVPKLWGLSFDGYAHKTNIPVGWDWINYINHGDFLSFASIAFLAIISLICFFTILPIYIKKKDWIYTSLVIIQILVLLLAASNLISVGGH